MKTSRNFLRKKRKVRIRKKIKGTSERPRMVVFRSNRYIYIQLIDDTTGNTLTSYSSLKFDGLPLNCETAQKVGKELAKRALEKGIQKVVFDRNGYIFHGRVKAVAEGAREVGLKF